MLRASPPADDVEYYGSSRGHRTPFSTVIPDHHTQDGHERRRSLRIRSSSSFIILNNDEHRNSPARNFPAPRNAHDSKSLLSTCNDFGGIESSIIEADSSLLNSLCSAPFPNRCPLRSQSTQEARNTFAESVPSMSIMESLRSQGGHRIYRSDSATPSDEHDSYGSSKKGSDVHCSSKRRRMSPKQLRSISIDSASRRLKKPRPAAKLDWVTAAQFDSNRVCDVPSLTDPSEEKMASIKEKDINYPQKEERFGCTDQEVKPIIEFQGQPKAIPLMMRYGKIRPFYATAKKIKAGTYGELYHGRDPIRQTDVIIKRLALSKNVDFPWLVPIIREIRTLQDLSGSKYIIGLLEITLGTSTDPESLSLVPSSEVQGLFSLKDFLGEVNFEDPLREQLCKEAPGMKSSDSIFLTFEALDGDLSDLVGCHAKEINRILTQDRISNADLYRPAYFTVSHVRMITFQILRALRDMAQCGYVHRDLKPQNIFVSYHAASDTYIAKLGDFGLARKAHHAEGWPFREGTAERGNVTHGVCTLWYRPPELILRSETHDFSIDIWSFGVVVYQMFFKLPPFKLASSETVLLYEIVMALGVPRSMYYQTLNEFRVTLPDRPPIDPVEHFKRIFNDQPGAFPDMDSGEIEDLADFIGQMLQVEPVNRPMALELLLHPFLEESSKRFEFMESNYPNERPIQDFTSQRKAEFELHMRAQEYDTCPEISEIPSPEVALKAISDAVRDGFTSDEYDECVLKYLASLPTPDDPEAERARRDPVVRWTLDYDGKNDVSFGDKFQDDGTESPSDGIQSLFDFSDELRSSHG